MPKNKRDIRYPKRVHVLVSEDQYLFVKQSLNGGIGLHIRNMIDAHQKYYNKELTILEKEFLDLEIKYVAMKKRIEDMRSEQKLLEDQRIANDKNVENAKNKLLGVYHKHDNRIDLIPDSVFKFYSDLIGISIQDLKVWLETQ